MATEGNPDYHAPGARYEMTFILRLGLDNFCTAIGKFPERFGLNTNTRVPI